MVAVDALRTAVAVVVGIVAAVLFSGYFPVPATLGVGLLAFVVIRRAFGAVYYGPHGIIGLFVVVGVAAVLDGIPPAATPVEGAAPLVVAGALLLVYETLLRVGVAADAGGFDEADIHGIWTGPGALVTMLAGVDERLGTRGFEATIGAVLSIVLAAVHLALVRMGVETSVTVGVGLLATGAIGVTGLAATPRSHFDGSLQGSVFVAVARPFRRVIAVVPTPGGGDSTPGTGRRSGPSGRSSGVRSDAITRSVDRVRGGVSGLFARSQGTATGATSEAGSETGDDRRRSVSPEGGSADSTPPPGDRADGAEKTDSTKTADSGRETPTVEECRNCGRSRVDVKPRVLVETPSSPSADNEIALCATCHSARKTPGPIEQCRTGVPVDRDQVIDGANGRCQSCGREAVGDGPALEPHVVVPLDGPGHPHDHNVVALCPSCHEHSHAE